MPAFNVVEVDPTGAGDCFGAAFVVSWLRNATPRDALKLGCAAGAFAVTKIGPMEGAVQFAELDAIIRQNR
jgi:sugar/nucleoside kinase (ribokinase family)